MSGQIKKFFFFFFFLSSLDLFHHLQTLACAGELYRSMGYSLRIYGRLGFKRHFKKLFSLLYWIINSSIEFYWVECGANLDQYQHLGADRAKTQCTLLKLHPVNVYKA